MRLLERLAGEGVPAATAATTTTTTGDAGGTCVPVPSPVGPGAEGVPEDLTAREAEVLGLLARGFTNPQIAKALLHSVSTVKVCVKSITAKLGVSDRTQAAVRAIELGLVSSGIEE